MYIFSGHKASVPWRFDPAIHGGAGHVRDALIHRHVLCSRVVRHRKLPHSLLEACIELSQGGSESERSDIQPVRASVPWWPNGTRPSPMSFECLWPMSASGWLHSSGGRPFFFRNSFVSSSASRPTTDHPRAENSRKLTERASTNAARIAKHAERAEAGPLALTGEMLASNRLFLLFSLLFDVMQRPHALSTHPRGHFCWLHSCARGKKKKIIIPRIAPLVAMPFSCALKLRAVIRVVRYLRRLAEQCKARSARPAAT